MNIEVLARQAQARWGTESQLDLVIEECAELINAIQKQRRGRTDFLQVLGEGVDVEIMIEQLKVIIEMPTLWKNIRRDKLERLQRLLLE